MASSAKEMLERCWAVKKPASVVYGSSFLSMHLCGFADIHHGLCAFGVSSDVALPPSNVLGWSLLC